MKYSIKFLTAALAMTALASCSDNLGYEGRVSQVSKDGMTGTLISPEIEGAGTRVGIQTDRKVVWAEDDAVQVYSLGKFTYNSYVVSGGAGTERADLTVEKKQNNETSDLYAVAQPKGNLDARISATKDAKPLIMAKIPSEYDWATVQDAGVAYKVPAPYWGKVLDPSEDNFSCKFRALTAYLMLDLKDLPAGTQSIMVTTHEDFLLNGNVMAGGENEPLSGSFDGELYEPIETEPLYVENGPAKLKKSPLLASQDFFRINFEPSEVDVDKTLFIPVIAQKYRKLYVIAVKEYNKGNYDIADGEILKVWENDEFVVNKVKPLSLDAEVVYDGTDPAELSNWIAAAADCNHTVRVRVTNDLAAGNLFIDKTLSNNNVQITFDVQQTNPLTIVEATGDVVSKVGKDVKWGDPVNPAALTNNGDKARTVSVDYAWGATGNINFYLPTSYVDICAEAPVTGQVQILAAKSKDMAKPMSPARDIDVKIDPDKAPTEDNLRITNNKAKDAPIVVHSAAQAITTFAQVFVMPQSKSSAIYVYNPETEITELGIGTRNPGALRLTDALVGTIAYEAAIGGSVITVSTAANIYTDGSAAIKNLVGGGNNVKLQADWTQRGLTVEAVAAGYDQAQIYTAAQLQGVGLAAGSALAPAVYEYKIADKVTDMWLGGETYPWIGASMQQLNRDLSPVVGDPARVALTRNIVIDGNFKGLYNLKLNIDDPYFNDPHSCCTTCSSADVKLSENLGLIRSIITTGKVTVKNFRLNDVEIKTENNKIPNVGSLTGFVYAGNDILLDDNETSNVRVSNIGGFAGGQFGYVWNTNGNIVLKGSVNKKVNSETDVNKRFVKTVGSNAGGFIGKVASNKGYFWSQTNTVDLLEVSATNGSNVGGIAGAVEYGATDNRIFGTTNVTIREKMFATELAKEATNKTRLNENSGNNVGGVIGFIKNNNNIAATDVNEIYIYGSLTATVKEMTAKNQFVGGLIGSADMVKFDANDDANNKAILKIATIDGSTIKVNVTKMTAVNGFAGGLVAKMISGDVKILKDAANATAETVDVEIGALNTAFAGAGVIGENTDAVLIKGAEDNLDKLTVHVENWSNTWAKDNNGIWEGPKFESGHAAMTSVVLKKLCGSFAHIIGHQNEDFDIWKAFVTIDKSGEGNKDGISNPTKKALLFPLHTDATNTVGVATDMYWGDEAGFVGFSNKTGSYLVNGQKHADQQYNYRKNY